MWKKFILFLLIVYGVIPALAQRSPEELGERIFDLFQNESYSFRALLPTTDQLIDKAETVNPELIKNRLDDYEKDYKTKLKSFQEKCRAILIEGKADGIVWPETVLDSVIPYRKNITLKDIDQSVTIEMVKLAIYFSFEQKPYCLMVGMAYDFDGQYLVSNDEIEFRRMIILKKE
ncbi:MAG TPA: hypothetical protein PKH79_09795 [Prolixibacteraceae bacterium]|nr:hypothetical protein [Prolixibacteraceae bacterium]HPS11811.1 hypothetical protein [Prolixibacteraceae bacterium]